MIENHEEVLAYLREMRKRGDEQASKLLDINKELSLDECRTNVLYHLQTYGLPHDLPFFSRGEYYDLCEIVQSLDVTKLEDHAEYVGIIREIFDDFGLRIHNEWKELYE